MDEIAHGSVANPSSILGVVEDDVFPHIKETGTGYFWTPLEDTVEDIVMERDVLDWAFEEVRCQ